jgi:riboflavin kinase/FMN adenylyltransferase
MMNIGTRPTLETQWKRLSLEVNIFDFSETIYDHNIKIVLLDKIRNEQKFANIEALKQQLATDKTNAITLIDNYRKDV